MNDMARIVRSDDGQSVELPEGYRFDGTEVRISREGGRVVLEQVDGEIDQETGLTIDVLRGMIQEGLDSGDAGPWDVEEVKRVGRERLALHR